MKENITKIWRFVLIYGLRRTLFKVIGRFRIKTTLVWRSYSAPDIAVIGCGQFGFATIGYYLTSTFGRRLLWCYDPNLKSAFSMAQLLSVPKVADTPSDALDDPDTQYVYIASNHASHTDYAIQALKSGKIVFVEKPIAVNFKQLSRLHRETLGAERRIYAGYNRPLSKSIRYLHRQLKVPAGPLSLSCFVSGHVIDPLHWYREPGEGTRICGNAGHWIDLFVHMLSWRGSLPSQVKLQLLSANEHEPDDNFTLSIASDQGDIFSLMLTARTEPFEGINETINIQWDDVIATINDFRSMTVRRGTERHRIRSWPKDVGHQSSILQPFQPVSTRAWSEVIVSSILMLHAAEMVCCNEVERTLNLIQELHQLNDEA